MYGFFPKIFWSRVWSKNSESVWLQDAASNLGRLPILILVWCLWGFQCPRIELHARKVYTKFKWNFRKSLNPIVCQKWLFFHHHQWNGYKSIIEQASSPLLYPSQQQVWFLICSSQSHFIKVMRWATFIITIRNIKAWTVCHLIFSQHCCLSKEIKTNIFTETMMSSENKMANSSSVR